MFSEKRRTGALSRSSGSDDAFAAAAAAVAAETDAGASDDIAVGTSAGGGADDDDDVAPETLVLRFLMSNLSPSALTQVVEQHCGENERKDYNIMISF